MSYIPPKPPPRSSNVGQRIAGTAPTIGRVNRMSGTGELPPSLLNRAQRKPDGKRRRKRRSSSTRRPSVEARASDVLRRWLILVLGLAGLAFCGMVLWTLLRQSDSSVPGPGVLAAEASLARSIDALSSDQALAKTRELLAASSPAELAELMRPGALSPDEAFAQLQTLILSPEKMAPPVWIGSVDSLSVPIEWLAIPRAEGGPILVFFTPDSSGKWQADLDALTRHSEPPFQSLLDHQIDNAMVRVMSQPDSYYNGIYSDESKWVCFALFNPQSLTLANAYCKRGSAQEFAMMAIFKRQAAAASSPELQRQPKGHPARVTLQLQHLPAAAARQFQITAVLADDWVLDDHPFDQGFPTIPVP